MHIWMKLTFCFFSESTTVIEDWDCSFPSDQTAFPSNENTESAHQLLTGFFDFWLPVDFRTKLICTRDGQIEDMKVKVAAKAIPADFSVSSEAMFYEYDKYELTLKILYF